MAYKSLRITILCVEISGLKLKRFGNGGYLKSRHEIANSLLNHNFSTLWAPPRAHKGQVGSLFRSNWVQKWVRERAWEDKESPGCCFITKKENRLRSAVPRCPISQEGSCMGWWGILSQRGRCPMCSPPGHPSAM